MSEPETNYTTAQFFQLIISTSAREFHSNKSEKPSDRFPPTEKHNLFMKKQTLLSTYLY